MKRYCVLDPLYGDLWFDDDISSLIMSPVLQRLRHVRLSNIDSINAPGFANVSRYEHVIGVAYLSSETGLARRLAKLDQLALIGAGLLHDWAITSFGHLVEEAFKYLNTGFDHETKLYELITGERDGEVGGVERQILHGRQTQLERWARRVVGPRLADQLLVAITTYIRGRGRFGPVICGDIDLDNIDSVFRMAHHMGVAADKNCPLRLARAIVGVDEDTRDPVFRDNCDDDVRAWLSLREGVYQRLMLAELDFAGKLMLLYATVCLFKAGEIDKSDWNLTDDAFLQLLLNSRSSAARDTAMRWLTGELWDLTPLHWMSGQRPEFPEVLAFSQAVSESIDRQCFAYCIKDKRQRKLTVRCENGDQRQFGSQASQWLLGIGSPVRRPFTAAEIEKVVSHAQDYFGVSYVRVADELSKQTEIGNAQACLL